MMHKENKEKTFGDYFKEASTRNPIDFVTEEEFALQNKLSIPPLMGSPAATKRLHSPDKTNPIYASAMAGKNSFNNNNFLPPKKYGKADDNDDEDEFDIGKVKAKYYKSVLNDRNLLMSSSSTSKQLNNKTTQGDYHSSSSSKTYDYDDANNNDTVKQQADDFHKISSVPESFGRDTTYNIQSTTSKFAASSVKPFQPGSTPDYLGDHFMMWNSVGIIQAFSDSDGMSGKANDNAKLPYGNDAGKMVEIEFFDKTVHHTIRLNCDNSRNNYTLGDLSDCAVVLATQNFNDILLPDDLGEDQSTFKILSKLRCLHFSSWDSNKDWEIEFPNTENVQTLTLGFGWCAVGMNTRIVRVFDLTGFQRLPFYIPGDIICMKGQKNILAVIYKDLGNLYCLYLYDIHLNLTLEHNLKIPVLNDHNSKYARVNWIGFSETENLYVSYASGHVFGLLLKRGATWIPVANTKEILKNKSDNYWLVSLQEYPSQIRAILCKGSNYPLTLPKPNVILLSFNMPFIPDVLTENSNVHENDYWSSWYKHHQSSSDSQSSQITDDKWRKLLAEQSTAIMKLFAVCCQMNQDAKAYELCKLMPNIESAKLALKYATKSRKVALTKRLTKLIEDHDFDSNNNNLTLNSLNNNVRQNVIIHEPYVKKCQSPIRPPSYNKTPICYNDYHSNNILDNNNNSLSSSIDNDYDRSHQIKDGTIKKLNTPPIITKPYEVSVSQDIIDVDCDNNNTPHNGDLQKLTDNSPVFGLHSASRKSSSTTLTTTTTHASVVTNNPFKKTNSSILVNESNLRQPVPSAFEAMEKKLESFESKNEGSGKLKHNIKNSSVNKKSNNLQNNNQGVQKDVLNFVATTAKLRKDDALFEKTVNQKLQRFSYKKNVEDSCDNQELDKNEEVSSPTKLSDSVENQTDKERLNFHDWYEINESSLKVEYSQQGTDEEIITHDLDESVFTQYAMQRYKIYIK